MDNREKMIGETIQRWHLSDDHETLTMTMVSGNSYRLTTWGDCCSFTWIESIDGAEALSGGTITAVEDIDMPDLGNVPAESMTSVDEVAYYGLRITTTKGRAVLDYRNTSNGYYGGGLDVTRYAKDGSVA